MAIHRITRDFDNSGSRNDVRQRVVDCFMLETPGQGSGDLASRYEYVVKELAGGNDIVLTRPANLKNGFDFLIRVIGIDFNEGNGRQRDYPSHENILEDLRNKRNENSDTYRNLHTLINNMYECENVLDEEFEGIHFESGYDSIMIVHVFKWFFIEQDIRYWNYSGRDMLMSGVPGPA